MTYNPGEAFGERSLATGNPRASTCIANDECFCAVVEKDIYLKVLNKLQTEKNHRMNRFLRQIEFIHNWTSKEVMTFNYQLKVKDLKKSGSVII